MVAVAVFYAYFSFMNYSLASMHLCDFMSYIMYFAIELLFYNSMEHSSGCTNKANKLNNKPWKRDNETTQIGYRAKVGPTLEIEEAECI